MNNILALGLGVVFGFGLILSGMNNPQKVLAFLDVAGLWNPSLALVMAGAIGVAIGPFQWLGRGGRSWLGGAFRPPGRTAVDGPLLLGSTLFGVGWGLSGFCPGPALVGIGSGYLPAIVFSIAMIFGMEIQHWIVASRQRRVAA